MSIIKKLQRREHVEEEEACSTKVLETKLRGLSCPRSVFAASAFLSHSLYDLPQLDSQEVVRVATLAALCIPMVARLVLAVHIRSEKIPASQKRSVEESLVLPRTNAALARAMSLQAWPADLKGDKQSRNPALGTLAYQLEQGRGGSHRRRLCKPASLRSTAGPGKSEWARYRIY